MAKGSRSGNGGSRNWSGRDRWGSYRPPVASPRAVRRYSQPPRTEYLDGPRVARTWTAPQVHVLREREFEGRGRSPRPSIGPFVRFGPSLPYSRIASKEQAHVLSDGRPLTLCEKRKQRREVLFASGFGGSTAKRIVRRVVSSLVGC